MFVIILTYLKPLEIVESFLIAHRNYLEENYQKNYLFASGPQNPREGGVLLSQLKDKKLVMEIIANDPFHVHNIADYKVIEFNPVKYHPKFDSFVE